MRFRQLVQNWLSYLGAVISGLAFVVFLFLMVLHSFTDATRAPYAGLVIFIGVPAVLLLGLVLVVLGMLIQWRSIVSTGVPARFPVVDLNDPRSRIAVTLLATGAMVLLFLTVFGSFQAYEATESVAFCGTTCHSVMAPEYTTYLHSPHARIRCVECHVGPGADWYVKSKLSGTYQVYSVLFKKYPQPIAAPITSLRPAQETCERCHWPKQFFGGQQRRRVHFLPDEQNTRWEIDLLIKTGGGSPATGVTEGIHWHMNIDNRVEYIAADSMRQQIPWVRITNLTSGKVTEYASTDNPLSPQDVARATIRKMDCMDCHNRPTHIYRSPTHAVNLALDNGKIDATLPFIKRTAVQLLAAQYDSSEAALSAIEQGVNSFYRENYPQIVNDRKAAISGAVTELQNIYRDNFFPWMKARWDAYPDNIGHFMFQGCFRCHDGAHKTADGKTLTKDCTACHTILAQGRPPELAFAGDVRGLEFKHPEDIGDMWQQMKCNECHTGAAP